MRTPAPSALETHPYYFARAAVTEYHKLGGKTSHLLLSGSLQGESRDTPATQLQEVATSPSSRLKVRATSGPSFEGVSFSSRTKVGARALRRGCRKVHGVCREKKIHTRNDPRERERGKHQLPGRWAFSTFPLKRKKFFKLRGLPVRGRARAQRRLQPREGSGSRSPEPPAEQARGTKGRSWHCRYADFSLALPPAFPLLNVAGTPGDLGVRVTAGLTGEARRGQRARGRGARLGPARACGCPLGTQGCRLARDQRLRWMDSRGQRQGEGGVFET
ncbi:uncharacterized protein [Symphalangus syndactylus]|uniref:uncharacterized protein n=1 Tax=Symphalangus syndactylus TaxID=9590 RepID=UPI003006026E